MERGNICTVRHDIVVSGELAFVNGQSVVIERIDPNPQRPEYKYVVFSDSMGKMFQLSDNDIEFRAADTTDLWRASPAPGSARAHAAQPARADSFWRALYENRGTRYLMIGLIVVVGILAVYFGFKILKGGQSGPEGVARSFLQSGADHEVEKMAGLIDPDVLKTNAYVMTRLETGFKYRTYGLGYLGALKYATKFKGDRAEVEVTVTSNIIRDNLSPPNTMVPFSHMDMVRRDGKWFITDWRMSW